MLALLLAALFALLLSACGTGADTAATSADYAGDTADAADDAGDAAEDAGYAEAPREPDAAVRSDGVAGEAEELAAEDTAGNADSDAATTGSAGGAAQAQLPDLGRDIIFTARLEIASTDISAATREAIRSIEARGGFLFSQETRGGAGGSSVLTFKVLPDQFQSALESLGSIGTVQAQSVSAEDVSAIVVDLESRINTAEASVTRLRNLLEDASELETIATLENQLLQRETTLEQLRGQLRSVRNQVDLATITVVVSELTNRPALALDTMAYRGHDGGFGCFDVTTARTVDAGDPLSVCYRLRNVGDTPLVGFAIEDPALGASIGSAVVVDGSITRLDPGQSVVLVHEVELDESVRLRTSATATALDTDGNELDGLVEATAAILRLDVVTDDSGIPSFGEVLSDSWNALTTAAIVIALVAVAIAPFAAVALLIAIPVWMVLRRRRNGAAASDRVLRPEGPTAPSGEATHETHEAETLDGDDDPGDVSTTQKAATTS